MTAMMVAPSRGMAGTRADSIAARVRSMPFCRRTAMPSATTMALSTIMPRAMTSAPSDMRCKSISNMAMSMKLTRIVTMRAVPMITPMRSPMVKAMMTSTISTASAKLMRKSLTALLTTSDIQCTRCSSIPIGNRSMSPSMD